MKSIRWSVLLLVAANGVPLIGAAAFGWSVYDILMLYWAENVIVGVINVARMVISRSGANTPQFGNLGDVNLIPFFAVHYGMFCYGHYTFIQHSFPTEPWFSNLWIGVAALAVSHSWSFVTNFVGAGEYRRTTRRKLMQRPYGRVLVMQITVILGAFLMAQFGDPIWMLAVLVVIKTAIDWSAHLKERKLLAEETTAA